MHKALATSIAAAVLAAPLIALWATQSRGAITDAQRFEQIEKGRYLSIIADCAACHTNPDGGKPYAGGRAIETPFGNVVSANITPDNATGIGTWSDEDFDNAVRHGRRPNGDRLYPAMPYPAYTKMPRGDVLAIRAYLNTIASAHNAVDRNTLPFPLDIRTSMLGWNWLFFTPGPYKPDPQKSLEWNYGRYLVEGPGHCVSCHTTKNFLGGDKSSGYLRGNIIQGWFAPDLTNDERTGLGRWSTDDIVTYLRTGHNRTSTATGPMAEEISHSSSRWNDNDLKSVATYLKSLPGRQDNPAPVGNGDAMMVAGQAIYRDQCAACHMIDGKGVPQLFPSLAEAPSVRSDDPSSLIRVILRGARTVTTGAEPTGPGMPSYGWQLNDEQVAAVATYVRNAWKPAASAVSASTVKQARDDLHARAD
jgi:mono/diheme cytochrome c family protein